MDALVFVPGLIDPKLVVIPRQDSVQKNAGNGGDGETGQGHGRSGHLEGQSLRKAQTADQNDGGDDQVAGVGEA